MINNEALKKIKKEGVEVEYLEKFKEYTTYDEESGELTRGCQAYYYTFFMIPYIKGLSVNYSPDYRSLSVIVEGGSSKELQAMIDSVVGVISIKNDLVYEKKNDLYEVDNTKYTRRASLGIDESYLEEYLSELKAPYEIDILKLRISASAYRDYSEIVVTPMLCPICDDVAGVDMEGLPFYLSGKFINEHREKIISGLKNGGFNVLRNSVMPGMADDR